MKQLYAGVTDSALTNHGILQAERLGRHFSDKGVRFTHVFSSDLQRAFMTAESIRGAQPYSLEDGSEELVTIPLSLLREQDFGSYEGKHVSARLRPSKPHSEDPDICQHKTDGKFRDVESKEAMRARMNEFLDRHLLPLLEPEVPTNTVAVVSHGIILSVLWRCLRKRFPPGGLAAVPGVIPPVNGKPLEYLGSWSNSGYLELEILPVEKLRQPPDASSIVDSTAAPPLLHNWFIYIKQINALGHLASLKRTGGGVGSAKHDFEQQKIDRFFSKSGLS
ncbi:MAG: hypothetical protein M1826_001778 [Phylliscum demangeonii]|nr:MAG: hypothetical protein M1826_001778 [Phylliscum demangeonii]